MTRWNTNLSCEVEAPAVESFTIELISLCRKYNLTIEHEDSQGAFIFSAGFMESRMDNLTGAHVQGEFNAPLLPRTWPVMVQRGQAVIQGKKMYGGVIELPAEGIDPNGYYTFEAVDDGKTYKFTDIKPTIIGDRARFEMWMEIK